MLFGKVKSGFGIGAKLKQHGDIYLLRLILIFCIGSLPSGNQQINLKKPLLPKLLPKNASAI